MSLIKPYGVGNGSTKREDLAGKTVYDPSTGMNVTYNENGYFQGSKRPGVAGTDPYRAPSVDTVTGSDRDKFGGSSYDKQYFTNAELENSDYYRKLASSGAISWDEAHRYVEGIRNKYGYSGGSKGDQYTPYTGMWDRGSGWGLGGGPYASSPSYYTQSGDRVSSYMNQMGFPAGSGEFGLGSSLFGGYGQPPEYTPRYEDDIELLIQQLKGSSYGSFKEGNEYQTLEDQYSALGQNAMQDVLGQLASRTGGYASSYATAAAGQAYNDYMTTLEDAARAMYQDQLNQQLQNLGILTDAENTNYNQYLNELNQWNTDRNFAYNQYLDDRNFLYGMNRDSIEDQRYQDNLLLEKAENLAAYGDFSGYRDLGYTDDQIKLMQAAYQSQLAAQDADKKRSTPTPYKPRLTLNQTLDALEKGIRSQSVLSAYEYYYGEPFRETGDDGSKINDYSELGEKAKNIANAMSRSNSPTLLGTWAETISKSLENGQITEAEADFLMRAIGF